MPFPAPKPTILLVHGSWHTPDIYAPLLQTLNARGFETHCPQLPTASPEYLLLDPANPSRDQPPPPDGHPVQTADAEVLVAILFQLVEEESKQVLVVAHSSGGWSSNEAILPAYQCPVRQKAGKSGGVLGIFCISALLCPPGESVLSTMLSALSSSRLDTDLAKVFTFHPHGISTVKNPADSFFHDLVEQGRMREVDEYSHMLSACPTLTTGPTNDAMSDVRVGYLVCESDRVLPAKAQESMIRGLEERRGKEVARYRCEGGHECFLAYTEVVARQIEKFVGPCLET
ncbi:alpha/beta-hydrolase [Lophiostoma macrostomum CBS 122681]|uniref:Alpha/beta-hydrolase n=1 Tax=Lophiostoma macrostomum CBS 122681 TaxID=1314788 RepID=A0A6A6SPP8_9PLEO|nr:alpha/beta-hydrolase [Lophiostoma macrostomum CBS 122681]